LIPSLPNIKPVFVAFIRGARETFERFTSEYAPGGKLDQATPEQRWRAWMPATNDANEGVLGWMRRMLRERTQLSLLVANGIAMYRRNDTAQFVKTHFRDEDELYCMQEARKLDTNGSDKEFQRLYVETAQRQVAEELKKRHERKEKADKKFKELAATVLVLEDEELTKMTIPKLDQQLEFYRTLLKDEEVPLLKKDRGTKKKR
jgi:hypothetical protein